MNSHTCHPTLFSASGKTALLFLCIVFLFADIVSAQENVLGPPDVLQYPTLATPDAARGLGVIFLRDKIEKGANLALCEALMREAGRPIPSPFEDSSCEPSFAEKVRNGEGVVHWADGARPLECGESCVGRPFMSKTQFVDQPNLRRAMLYGHLKFVADPPGPFNRDITYGYEVFFTCNAINGARNGDFTVDIKFGQPVIGDPGPIESVLDFLLLPAGLSNFIERRMQRDLAAATDTSEVRDTCRSIGAFRADDPQFDSALFDLAPSSPRFRGSDMVAATAVGDRATIHFIRLKRKPLPPMVDAGHAGPGNPSAGYFNVFLNGSLAAFPPKTATQTGGIDIPETGGVVELNYCRTIDLNGSDHLQLLFTNGLGGGAWSQFGRAEMFGEDVPRTLSTGRTIVVPGFPGPPDPVTGRPTPAKPQAIVVREFELTYTIAYDARPDAVVVGEPAGPARPVRDSVTRPLGDPPLLMADPDAPAPEPCRKI